MIELLTTAEMARADQLTIAAGQGLPQYKTALVGRRNDVAAVRALVDRNRLVTIVGFGGMGKTRVAVEVAQQWAEVHRARAHFVDALQERRAGRERHR